MTVKPSTVLPDGAAGEGLFSKVSTKWVDGNNATHHFYQHSWNQIEKGDVKAGQIVSWYNGVRVPCHVVDGRPDWSLNDNVINLDEETAIDVPPQWSSTKAYCASLGIESFFQTVLAAQLKNYLYKLVLC